MKKYILILLTLAVIGATSCENWLDVNYNPNDATNATADLVLPGVLTTWASQVSGLNTTTQTWMGYWSHAGGWSGWYTTMKYEITSSFYPTGIENYYPGVLTDTKFIRDNSEGKVLSPAITDVVDAWYFSRLVDLYGDVPYSEACDPSQTLSPKYDDGAAIFADLIKRLDAAMDVFTEKIKGASSSEFGFINKSDVMFNGDFAKWRQLANTLKLRLVIRQTNVKTASELAQLMNNTASYGFLTADAEVNPGYVGSSGKLNPLWNSFGKNLAGTIVDANTQYALNSYFYEKLSYYNDPRLNQYFQPGESAEGELIPLQFGLEGDLDVKPNTTIAANYSWIPIAANATTANKRTNPANGISDGTKIMLYTEACFLQAEAIVRGILSGDAAALYEEGIRASMEAARVPSDDAIDEYLERGGVQWVAAQTDAQKLEKILIQKYISNYFLNSFESYSDYRRTGLPNPKKANDRDYDQLNEMLSYNSGIIRRQIPRIFPYPITEFTLNQANVQAAVDKQQVRFETSIYPYDARVFWDTAPKDITY